MLYKIVRCYFDSNYGEEIKELCAATTNKAKAEEVVRRMNAISKYNDGDIFEVVESENGEFAFVEKAEQRAIKQANGVVDGNMRYIAEREREIAAITTIKSLFSGATKAPKDMVPEMIAAIQGTNCGLFVCEYFSAHKLVTHYPNGKKETYIGENYARCSYLGIEDSRFHYSEKWDFDEDMERIEECILEAKEEIAEAKAFLENIR